MLEDLAGASSGAIVLLQVSGHNPTGVDPTLEQWEQLRQLMRLKGLFTLFRFCISVAQSYSKNMGLYGERVGALNIVCKTANVASLVDSQLKLVIRPMYSNPPIHGASIVTAILKDRDMQSQWTNELKIMTDRISNMRRQLYNALRDQSAMDVACLGGTPGDWSHTMRQVGMYSLTGLNAEQVAFMTREYNIYMSSDG
ncbi:hypothetical protein Pint_07231 [Pistacia integerrima]|uniref:Uncharacterized protein n=1 Tax=Pistacia integerrima TaxID=434235 RepID=A0ACC0XT97_9ROSI|nr:hypothetical protein Pint_07231 [Pistacia integerrima]